MGGLSTLRPLSNSSAFIGLANGECRVLRGEKGRRGRSKNLRSKGFVFSFRPVSCLFEKVGGALFSRTAFSPFHLYALKGRARVRTGRGLAKEPLSVQRRPPKSIGVEWRTTTLSVQFMEIRAVNRFKMPSDSSKAQNVQ